LTSAPKIDRYTLVRFKNFLPDLEILKPPEEPSRKTGLFFYCPRESHVSGPSIDTQRRRPVRRRKNRMKSLHCPTKFIASSTMPPGHDKWIRSINDNPAGKVVADPEGNRWEWNRGDLDETSRLLRKLNNDELAIEQTDIVPNRARRGSAAKGDAPAKQHPKGLKKSADRDAGGGFDPYDSSGRTRRR
jgi:hypothetical protein